MKDKVVHRGTLDDGRPVVVYERSRMVPNPALQMIPTEQVVETWYDCPAPDEWPKVRIRSRRWLWWVLARAGLQPGMVLDDDRFNAAFRVDAEDEDFALVLLSPEMQKFLLEKRWVDWSLGRGHLKLFYRGRFKRKRMPRSLDRLVRFWSLVPPELHAWEEPPAAWSA